MKLTPPEIRELRTIWARSTGLAPLFSQMNARDCRLALALSLIAAKDFDLFKRIAPNALGSEGFETLDELVKEYCRG